MNNAEIKHIYVSSECLTCFLKQAFNAASLLSLSESTKIQVLKDIMRFLSGADLNVPPPVIAGRVYGIIKTAAEGRDPYLKVKKADNASALAVFPELREFVNRSEDPLLVSAALAIEGNMIDHGAKDYLDEDFAFKTVYQTVSGTVKELAGQDFELFRSSLSGAKKVLYLLDNAGEAVFDMLFIEQIKRCLLPEAEFTAAAKESAIINDITYRELEDIGMDRVCNAVSTGASTPGAVLSRCSPAFREQFKASDMIISKGQGNFESLAGSDYPVFFLFKVKCPVVSALISRPCRSVIFKYNTITDGGEK